MDAHQAKDACRDAIQKAFEQVRADNKGSLEAKAAEIGIKRQQLEQYADGTMPGGDVLLAAFIGWGIHVRIKDPHASADDPKWWECGMTGKDRTRQKKKVTPEQLPLFRAIESLVESDMDVGILKKEPGRIQLSVDILFRKTIA